MMWYQTFQEKICETMGRDSVFRAIKVQRDGTGDEVDHLRGRVMLLEKQGQLGGEFKSPG